MQMKCHLLHDKHNWYCTRLLTGLRGSVLLVRTQLMEQMTFIVISYSGYYGALIRLKSQFDSAYHYQIIDAEL